MWLAVCLCLPGTVFQNCLIGNSGLMVRCVVRGAMTDLFTTADVFGLICHQGRVAKRRRHNSEVGERHNRIVQTLLRRLLP